MPRHQDSIDVGVPAHVAYEQWMRFEEFPRFMEDVKEVRQLDERHIHWRAQLGHQQEEWESEIIENVPAQTIAWRSTTGRRQSGRVNFEPISGHHTRINLELDYETRSLTERLGDTFGIIKQRVHRDLQNFKNYIESH